MLALVLALSSAPPWCAEVQTRAANPELDLAQLDEAAGLVPNTNVQTKIRELSSQESGLPLAREALATVAAAGCRDGRPAADVADAPAKVRALEATDKRFGGVRVGDDAIDRLIARFWVTIGRLLESKGMQRYATSARVIYLSALVVFVVLVLGRLGRALLRSRGARSTDAGAQRARILVERKRAFRSLRDDAAAALAAGNARAAIDLGVHALLSRVAERAPGHAQPSQTPREVVGALLTTDAPTAHIVAPPLANFERVAFAIEPDLEDARAFLSEVDRAETALQGRNA